MVLDVAIIGGGVAGCYCAYRLTQSRGDSQRVALFESSDRIGGRLWSVPLQGGAIAEIGGMFFRDNHRSVRALVGRLGLAAEAVDFKRNGQFARGKFFADADFAAEALPFALAEDERKGTPALLLAHALEQVAAGSTDLWPINRVAPRSPTATFAFLRGVRHRGRALHECSLWNVLTEVISGEAYALLAATLGSMSLIRNVNAFDGVWNLLHELGDGAAFRLVDGYQRLPLCMAERAAAEGAVVDLNQRLVSVARGANSFRLVFESASGEKIETQTRQLILALPQRSLQRIDFDPNLFEDPAAFKSILDHAVRPMRSCKTFFLYDHAWWSERGGGAAHIAARYTDMPMQQCYCFGQADRETAALVMAAYADDVSATYWQTLKADEEQFQSAASNAEDAMALSASRALVETLQVQIAKVLHQEGAPAPTGAIFFDWANEPFGGAWHAWAPHFQSWDIRSWMRRPNPSLDLFVCGEAYSQRNGWVEGAINSAERTLEQLGLARPSWITDPDFQFEVDDKGVEGNDDSNDRHVQRPVAGHGVAA